LNAVKCDRNIQSVVETVVNEGVSGKSSYVEKIRNSYCVCWLITQSGMNQIKAVFHAVHYGFLYLPIRILDTIMPDIQHSNMRITIILRNLIYL